MLLMKGALSMAKHLTIATVRGDVNAQYHWANLIMLDALARGANGPEVEQSDARRLMDNQDRITGPAYVNAPSPGMAAISQEGDELELVSCGPIGFWQKKPKSYGPLTEDAIEEARR